MFSSTAKYAIRAMIYMAMQDRDKIIGIKQIAKDLDLPVFFLGKIMQTLAKHKILVSYKGPNGGFAFNKDPKEVSLLDIVEIFDGTEIFNQCILGLTFCKDDPSFRQYCPMSEDLDVCVYRIYETLKSQSVGQLASSFKLIDQLKTV